MILVGDTGVGKTCIFSRLTSKEFNSNHTPTLGLDFKFRNFETNGTSVKLQVWDTAGQERFRSMCNAYYKGSDIIAFVFDLSNPVSLSEDNEFCFGALAGRSADLLFV